MTEAPAISSPPVLVLGTHRSGTSAVMGLLVEGGGLALGHVMPPTPANVKGYFESAAVVKSHNEILDSLDRDWTCPPMWLDSEDVALDGLVAEVQHLAESGRPWGVKDPRLLFMLPVWTRLLPSARLVGVIRDHEEVVRSLVARDGLEPGVADTITASYVRRLRLLSDRLNFPVIDFSAAPDDVLDHVGKVAVNLGLPWDEKAARAFFDPSLANARARGMAYNEDIDHLRNTGATNLESAVPVTADDLFDALRKAAEEPDEFDRFSGPRAAARRRAAWAAVPKDFDSIVEYTRSRRVATSHDPVRTGHRSVECRDLMTLYQDLRHSDVQPDAIVLPDVLSWVRRDELPSVLGLIHEHTPRDGLVVVGLATADRDTNRMMGHPSPTLDDARAAAVESGFVALSITGDSHFQVLRLVAVGSTTSLLRQVLEGETRVALPRERDVVTEQPGPGKDRQEADEWRRRYERLRGRRSVRLALSFAALARPVFRAVRRVRKARPHG